MKPPTLWQRRPATLLARLIDAPDLVQQVRRLPASTFSALVRQVGVEDAGELVALATTEQIVTAFDEDLFGNDAPGERERFDPDRFVAWLQVLLEAGDTAAAQRVSELSEDFVMGALTHLVWVLDHDALLARLGEGDQSAVYAEKALESALAEEIDGYLLIARKHEGWDAVVALVLALDQNHRSLLERLLDRCASVASPYVEDLDRLTTALSEEESLAEDVEAEREDRRARQGYVEPRAARSFLTLATAPLDTEADAATPPRDVITRAYFRDLDPIPSFDPTAMQDPSRPHDLLGVIAAAAPQPPALPAGPTATATAPDPTATATAPDPTATATATAPDPTATLTEAMRLLRRSNPQRFTERLSELTYLANVLVSGAQVEGRRLRPSEATEAVLATVALGAELQARRARTATGTAAAGGSAADVHKVLASSHADLLFRVACGALTAHDAPSAKVGFLRSAAELPEVLALIF